MSEIGAQAKLTGEGVILGPDGKPKGKITFESEPIPEELAKRISEEYNNGGNSPDNGS